MRTFIIGSDWWTDCDDAAAFRLIARAVNKNEISVAGIGINACMEYSAPSLAAFLRFEGMSLPPMGIDIEATDFGGNPPYQKRLAAECDPYVNNEDLEDAASLYTRILKSAAEPVEIIEIGFPQVIAKVLREEPELFADKVKKVWMMAGKWDEQPAKENNFARNGRSRKAAAYFCKNCPAPITFLGWEVSNSILTGGELCDGDKLHIIFSDHGSAKGRSSWDPMLVKLALTGDAEKAGYRTVRGTASVNAETGENFFTKSETGLHEYVVKTYPDDYYKNMINTDIASK